ncbi:uncharacterized protein LOC116267303 isoform X2 [Nymphaea colorata]|uniref:uncharacterized protein LOC116267303 isoform X2 n=1 Tax=Nymphaea colorata TaxID=210225 RepID=UPI00129D83DE|nr:uncharacterized protein LOC116267303 isoform X2 [Nymphaea colorata]
MALRCPPLETMSNFPSVNGGVSILDASKSFAKVSSARAAPSVKRDRSHWRNLDFFCAKREYTRSFNLIPTLTEDAGTGGKGAGSLRSDWIRSGLPATIQFPEARKTEEGEGDKRDFLQGGWVYSNFSAPVQSSAMTRTKDEEDDKQDYYVNMGYAIRTLREELRDVFFKEPTFDIYREDIVFKDPLNTFEGINNYKMIFRALRMYGRIFFKALWVDILSIWQPVENVIMIRWTVHGAPRVFWDSHGRFDATSEYKLDRNGKIYEHRVDNVAFNSPPKFRVLAVEELIQTLGCPSTARPTYFEFSPEANTTDEQVCDLFLPTNTCML